MSTSKTPIDDLERGLLPIQTVFETIKGQLEIILKHTTSENIQSNATILKQYIQMLENVVGVPGGGSYEARKIHKPKTDVDYGFDGTLLYKTGINPKTKRRWKHLVRTDELEKILSVIKQQISPLKPNNIIKESKMVSYKVYTVLGALAKIGLIAHGETRLRYHSIEENQDFGYLQKNVVLAEIRSKLAI